MGEKDIIQWLRKDWWWRLWGQTRSDPNTTDHRLGQIWAFVFDLIGLAILLVFGWWVWAILGSSFGWWAWQFGAFVFGSWRNWQFWAFCIWLFEKLANLGFCLWLFLSWRDKFGNLDANRHQLKAYLVQRIPKGIMSPCVNQEKLVWAHNTKMGRRIGSREATVQDVIGSDTWVVFQTSLSVFCF